MIVRFDEPMSVPAETIKQGDLVVTCRTSQLVQSVRNGCAWLADGSTIELAPGRYVKIAGYVRS